MYDVDQVRSFVATLLTAKNVLANSFPIHAKTATLSVTNWRWENVGVGVLHDIAAQKDAKLKEKSIHAKLLGDVSITETATGKVLDSKMGHPIFLVPHLTAKAGFIVNGKEVQVIRQFRLRPGVYVNYSSTDNIEAFLNTTASATLKVVLDRQSGVVKLRVGPGAHTPIGTVLRAVGASDAEIKKALGPTLYEINQVDNAAYDKQVTELLKRLRPYAPKGETVGDTADQVRSFLASKPLDPTVTRVTLGEALSEINKDVLILTIKKLIDVANGNKEPDDRESIAFKTIHGVEDFILERLTGVLPAVVRKITFELNRNPLIATAFPPSAFSETIETFFTTSEFTRYSSQNNPYDIASVNNIVTIMGEGGISSSHALTDEVRAVHPSHYSALDILQTPEGERIGVTSHLTMSAIKRGNSIYLPVYNAKTGKREEHSVQDLDTAIIAFPDQYSNIPESTGGDIDGKPKPKTPEVKVRHGNSLKVAKASEVQYIYLSTDAFFSSTTAAIPFLNNNHANRVLMADKHIEQSVALTDPDVPLVQHRIRGRGYEEMFGEAINVKAVDPSTGEPIGGKVVGVSSKEIKLKTAKGTISIPLHDHYPLNSSAFMHDTPTVKVGDVVKPGQSLARNNFTKDNALAVGKTLTTAYMAYKGYNFEDGIVISEGAAKKLASTHKYEFRVERNKNVTLGVNAYLAAFPTERENCVPATIYDADGIIKKGQKVQPGTVLIPAIEEAQFHPEYDYKKLHRSAGIKFLDTAEKWDSDYEGYVLDVIKTGKFVKVIIKTDEPMQIGDKLSNRSGAKGIVVKIVPDNEMYQDESGKPIDILLNPAGVPGRCNPGQLFEAAAGKLAEKTGKTYYTDNFNQTNLDGTLAQIQKELAAAGISDEETVTDPTTNNTVARVLVGRVHTYKLEHQVRKKISGRGAVGEPYSVDEAPRKGGDESAQAIGALDTFSLLAGDATEFLKDAFGVKSQKNDEYWRAVQLGLHPPIPKTPHVAEKFVAMLLASGIDLKEEGSVLRASPLTDKEIGNMSHGELESPLVVKASDLSPESGGLFDPNLTGGIGGNRWNHIELAAPLVHPLMVDAVASVGKFKTKKELTDIIAGTKAVTVDGKVTSDIEEGATGGAGVLRILGKLDVDEEIKKAEAEATLRKGDQLNKIYKRLRYLRALKAGKLTPKDYINTKLPVIPPKFRQITVQTDGTLSVADAIHGYREVLLVNNQIKALRMLGVSETTLRPLHAALNAAVSGVVGVTPPITRGKNFKGFVSQIKGATAPKFGFFQSKVSKRTQDLSGRSTVIPNPQLNMDDVGLPKEMAFKIYKPFIVRKLVTNGYEPAEARKAAEDQTELALKALHSVMTERPVLMSRAPALHKFSFQAFKPVIVEGKAIEVNPLIVGGFNMDFDGDQIFHNVFVALDAEKWGDSTRISLENRQLCPKVDAERIAQLLKEHEMSFDKSLAVPVKTGTKTYCFHLQDFPHGEHSHSSKGQFGPIDWYRALPGTYVLSYDEKTQKTEWKEVTLWSKHHDCDVEIVTLKSGRQIITDDDPRAVYGCSAGTLEMTRFTPTAAEAAKVLVPRQRGSFTDTSDLQTINGSNVSTNKTARSVADAISLTEQFGYLVGVAAGDGWSDDKAFNIAAITPEIPNKCESAINSVLDSPIAPTITDFKEAYGRSRRYTYSSLNLAKLLADLVGKGADHKHLPSWYLSANRACREGMFAGLLDTDGSISISNGKSKPQLMANFASNSLRLVQDVQLLARSLDIDGRITASQTPAGRPCWMLAFSNISIKRWGGKGMVHPEKLAKLASIELVESNISARTDVIPISTELARHLRKALKAPRDSDKDRKSAYVVLSKAQDIGYLSRTIALRIIEWVTKESVLEHEDGAKWLGIVNNTAVTWDQVESIERTLIPETGYDLTVPGYETFMAVDGVILSNTAGIHVPVSEEARVEALEKMLPSKNLFGPRNNELMHMPTKETVVGIYKMTTPMGESNHRVKSFEELAALYNNKAIKANTPVFVEADNGTHCFGQYIYREAFPPQFRPPLMSVTARIFEQHLSKVARGASSEEAAALISKLKDLGNHYVSELGYVVSLKDLEIDTVARDGIMDKFKANISVKGFDAAAQDAVDEIALLLAAATDNRFVEASITSGAIGKGTNLAQMLASPVAVKDHRDKTIPIPITRSYAEGHDIASYISVAPGARKGLIDKGLSVASTGYLNRRLVNSNIEVKIKEADCKTTEGQSMDVSDKDIIGRYCLDPEYLNKPITLELQKRLMQGTPGRKLVMRSPLMCKSVGGICQRCYGISETGRPYRVGFHLGAMVGQTIGERATQVTLKAFHTGGAVSEKSLGFDRIQQILEMPNTIRGKAILSEVSGTVTKIEQAPVGGSFVYVDTHKHYVPREVGVGVTLGKMVGKGDVISSSGVVKPQELLEITGDIRRVQNYLVDELDKNYRDAKQVINRKIFETAITPLTNRARVKSAGSAGPSFGVHPGDILSINQIEHYNKEIAKSGGLPIEFEPMISGINATPFLSEDFVGSLIHERLKDTLQRAPSLGLKTAPRGDHPISNLALSNLKPMVDIKYPAGKL